MKTKYVKCSAVARVQFSENEKIVREKIGQTIDCVRVCKRRENFACYFDRNTRLKKWRINEKNRMRMEFRETCANNFLK